MGLFKSVIFLSVLGLLTHVFLFPIISLLFLFFLFIHNYVKKTVSEA